ncbi:MULTISPECIES: hypothetical protein [unclassified Inquilinus]|uniref:hypothetical protein n=1 Tax=unclassified Inquilinus TaxID=2645927 RepID=UPI003F8DC9CE
MPTKTALKGSVTVAATEKKPEVQAISLHQVDPAAVTLSQDRTKKLPLPKVFFMEADPAKIAKAKGHQVDPSRPASWSPVMPNLDLLAKSGNPFPSDAKDETVVTQDRYRPLVAVCRALWEALQKNSAGGQWMMPGNPKVIAEITKAAKIDNPDAKGCIRDTLRDLALYGLVEKGAIGPMRAYRLRA